MRLTPPFRQNAPVAAAFAARPPSGVICQATDGAQGWLPVSRHCHEAFPGVRSRRGVPRRIAILGIFPRCASSGAICQTTDGAQGASGELPLPRSRPPGRGWRRKGSPVNHYPRHLSAMRSVRRDMPNDRRRAGGLPAYCHCHETVPRGARSRRGVPRRITIVDIFPRYALFGAICQTTDGAQGELPAYCHCHETVPGGRGSCSEGFPANHYR